MIQIFRVCCFVVFYVFFSFQPLPSPPPRKPVPPPRPDAHSDQGDDLVAADSAEESMASAVIGDSPNSDALHFKIRKALARNASEFIGGHINVPEDQLAVRLETMRKTSLSISKTPPSDVGILGGEVQLPDNSDVEMEIALAGGTVVKPGEIVYLFEPYRTLFGKSVKSERKEPLLILSSFFQVKGTSTL